MCTFESMLLISVLLLRYIGEKQAQMQVSMYKGLAIDLCLRSFFEKDVGAISGDINYHIQFAV